MSVFQRIGRRGTDMMTANRRFEITDARGGAALNIRVVTQAEKTEIVGVQDDGVLKVRLMASPAGDPAANKELMDFLAARLNISTTALEIVGGRKRAREDRQHRRRND